MAENDVGVDDGFIDIVHPKIEGSGRVHPEAYDLVWKNLGWKKKTDNASDKTAAPGAAKKEG